MDFYLLMGCNLAMMWDSSMGTMSVMAKGNLSAMKLDKTRGKMSAKQLDKMREMQSGMLLVQTIEMEKATFLIYS